MTIAVKQVALSARTSFALLTTEFASQTRTICRSRAFIWHKLLETARSRNLAYAQWSLFQKSQFHWYGHQMKNVEFLQKLDI